MPQDTANPLELSTKLDQELSKRFIELDPAGYFIIFIDAEHQLICASHFTNTINEKGLAVDPATGKVIPVKGQVRREPTQIFKGRTAKELCIEIMEKQQIITKFDHAAYLGREAQRAEYALRHHQIYVQD